LAFDPQSVEAQTLLANALVARVLGGLADAAAADLERADGLIGQALAATLDPRLEGWDSPHPAAK
jgi:hypothetical protein